MVPLCLLRPQRLNCTPVHRAGHRGPTWGLRPLCCALGRRMCCEAWEGPHACSRVGSGRPCWALTSSLVGDFLPWEPGVGPIILGLLLWEAAQGGGTAPCTHGPGDGPHGDMALTSANDMEARRSRTGQQRGLRADLFPHQNGVSGRPLGRGGSRSSRALPQAHVRVGVPGWGVALLSLPRVPLQVDNGPMALKNLPEQLCKLSVGGDECVHILNPLPKE